MLPDNPTVGNEQPNGGAQVSPDGSGPIAGQSGTPDPLAVLSKQVSDLTAELRGLQGRQDKTGKTLKEHEAVLAEYKGLIARGMTPEAAEAEMGKVREQQSVADQLVQMKSTLDFLATRAGIAVTNPDVAAMVTKYQLDPNSPEVARVLATGKTGADLRAELADLALQKASRPAPTAAAAPVMGANTAPAQTDDVNKLHAAYLAELQSAAGNPRLVAQIKTSPKYQELRAQGLVN